MAYHQTRQRLDYQIVIHFIAEIVLIENATLIQTLDSLNLKYPEVGPDKLKELAPARAALVK